MSFPVVFHPQAREELRQARAWYRVRNVVAAEAFSAAIWRSLRRIAEHPLIASERVDGTPRFVVRGLPYVVVYTFRDSEIRVLAIAHARRHPGYWAARA